MAWIIVDNGLLAHVFSAEAATYAQIFILIAPRLDQGQAARPMRLKVRAEHRQGKSLLCTVVAEYSSCDDLPKR